VVQELEEVRLLQETLERDQGRLLVDQQVHPLDVAPVEVCPVVQVLLQGVAQQDAEDADEGCGSFAQTGPR
jgi:hypothetical protein